MALVTLLLVGCYRSHELGDAPVLRDAAPIDLGRRDAFVPSPSCEVLTVLDRDRSPWRSLACGPVTDSATVARGSAFDQIARESPDTCGRGPILAARRVRGGGALSVGEDQPIMDAHPSARGMAAAASGETLIVASGVQWTAFTDSFEPSDEGELAPRLDSVPGCVLRRDVTDLVARPTGWFAAFDFFECDVGGSQHRFYESDRLAPSSDVDTLWPGIGGAVAYENGAFGVSRVRDGATTRLYWWQEPGVAPLERTFGTNGSHVAVARWPDLTDGIVLAFLDDDGDGPVVRMVLLDPDGSVRQERIVPLPDRARFGAYGPVGIELATTDFGVVAGIELGWLGGRIDSGYVVMGFDRAVRPTLGALVELDSGSGRSELSLAGSGEEALVSVFTGTVEETTAESILIGCSP